MAEGPDGRLNRGRGLWSVSTVAYGKRKCPSYLKNISIGVLASHWLSYCKKALSLVAFWFTRIAETCASSVSVSCSGEFSPLVLVAGTFLSPFKV